MELLDNKSKLLGDDLQKEMKFGSKVKVVASYFSIYAYETLKKELENIEELEFIFPSPTFVSDGIKGTIKKEAKEFYIPKQLRESSLYGTEFEIRLRNEMTQRVIAKECAEWIKKKVRFKSNVTARGLQNFIYVDKAIIAAPNHDFTIQGTVKIEKEIDSTLTLPSDTLGYISSIQILVAKDISKKIKSIDIVQDTVIYETAFDRLDVPFEVSLPIKITTSYREFLGLMIITLHHSFQEIYRIFVEDSGDVDDLDVNVDGIMNQVGVS
jgi:hypothetical protein